MNLSRKVASALSFAHLASLGRGGKAQAEDNDPEKKDEDGKGAKAKAEDEDPEKDDPEKKDSEARAEDDDPSAEQDDPEKKDDNKESKAKGSKADGDGDDDKEEMSGKSAASQARLREQARCAAIFASSAAARNPVLAANLAFKTRMTRAEALAVLESTPAPVAAVSHPSRSANNPRAAATPAAAVSPQQAVASRWDQHLQAAAKAGRR